MSPMGESHTGTGCTGREGPPTPGRLQEGGAGTPSVLLRVSSRTLYSRTFSLWCWNSRHSLASSSLENLPDVFAWGK